MTDLAHKVTRMGVGVVSEPPRIERTSGERAPRPLVLVVDDDKRQAEFRAELLSQAGCATVIAGNVNDALTTIGDLLRLDLVITDITLSRLADDRSGVLVAHQASERFPGIPVVGLIPHTAAAAISDAERAAFALILEKGVRNVPELRLSIDQLAALAHAYLGSRETARR